MEVAPEAPTNEEPKKDAPKAAPQAGTEPGQGTEPKVQSLDSEHAPKSPGDSGTHSTEGQQRGPDGKFLPKDGQTAPPPEKKEPPPAPKKWKLADKEFESPDELAAAAERIRQDLDQAKAYKKYVEEAAQREKRAQSLEQRLKERPLDVLREAGHNDYELALARVKQEMELQRRFEGMSEEQIAMVRRTEQLEAELAKERSERRAEKEKAEAEAVRLCKNQRAQHWIGVVNKAFEVCPELPKNGEVQVRLIQEIRRNLKYGYEIPAEQLARKVLGDLQTEHESWDTDERFNAQAYVKKHPKRAEAIRAAVVASLQAAPQQTTTGAPPTSPQFSRKDIPTPERQGALTPEEHEAIIRKRLAAS